jgi:hypothetical protein
MFIDERFIVFPVSVGTAFVGRRGDKKISFRQHGIIKIPEHKQIITYVFHNVHTENKIIAFFIIKTCKIEDTEINPPLKP